MKSIDKNTSHELIINKSRFICLLYNINSIDEINILLKNVKEEYKGATHYCYAYILDEIKRFSDDNEPSGTAGMPILNVLDSNNLNHILCIVVRYFGGIKLGAGGLVRAYTKSVTSCLENVNIINLVEGKEITITFKYDNLKQIDNILKDINITNKDFSENITYTFLISNNLYNEINKLLNNYVDKLNIEKNILIIN